MRSTFLLFAAAAAFTAPACGGPAPPNEPRGSRPSVAQLAALRAQAEAACLCDRRRGTVEDEACWGDFNREIDHYSYSESNTFCGPSSQSWICFGSGSNGRPDENCIFRHRAHGACSAEEERQLKARNGGCGG